MVIYIGSDHKGFDMKEMLKKSLKAAGYSVTDLGDSVKDENDDYVDFASSVAERVSTEFETARGILICGSGVGVDVTANKFRNIRCALAGSPDQAFDSRHDDDSNILALGANYLDEEKVKKIVVTWLETPFSGDERFKRRLDKISALETKIMKDEERNQYEY
ncbi:RpiB/LacA/LacB family sugar-phosphate isomerase [Patescibacteria group bacterium]|nr:RpiB/LacA/LacB family sugar-phosphate isomerase [Patescibacteria group bacterium]